MFHVEHFQPMNYLPLDFIATAKANGLCEQYAARIANARSKRQLVDIALDENGVEWLAQCLHEGWGIDSRYIAEHFAAFNCGKYVWQKYLLTSAMFVMPQATEIEISTTQALIAGFNGVVKIPENTCCVIYAVDSDFNVEGGVAYAKSYNSRIGGNVKLRC